MSPDVCKVADKLTAPQCAELTAISDATACTVRTAALEYLAKNPLAKLKGQAEIKGQIAGCVKANVPDTFSAASFELNLSGKAHAAIDIDFDPSLLLQAMPALGLPSTAGLTCFAGFDKRFTGVVTTSLRDTVGSKVESETKDDRLVIRFLLDKKEIAFGEAQRANP